MDKIKDLQQWGRTLLASKEDSAIAALETDLLLAEVLQKDRLYLMLNGEEKVEGQIGEKFVYLLNQRLEGKPMAYLLGRKEFMEYSFKVHEGVLIPRDDTEEVIHLACQALKKIGKSVNLCGTGDCSSKKTSYSGLEGLEIGIGTGIISLILLSHFEVLKMIGVDINPLALENAAVNTKYLQEQLEESKTGLDLAERFTIQQSDLLSSLQLEEQSLDFVISNPPYIESHVIDCLDGDVKNYEPHTALDGGPDGLDFYRAIVKESLPYLKIGGFIAFEIGYNQGDRMQKLMADAGMTDIEVRQDLAGRDRAIIAWKRDKNSRPEKGIPSGLENKDERN